MDFRIKTIEEANKYVVEQGLAKSANFTGLSIESINIAIQSVEETREKYPFVKKFYYVGVPEYSPFKSDRKFAEDEPDALAWITPLVDRKDTVGSFCISLNYFSPSEMAETKKLCQTEEATSSWPKKCNTIKAVFDHELGHVLDYSHSEKISDDPRIQKLYKKHMTSKSPKNSMWAVLSEYAGTDREEFLAEAWCEYRNNPKPRKVARTVGGIVDEYNEKYKQSTPI